MKCKRILELTVRKLDLVPNDIFVRRYARIMARMTQGRSETTQKTVKKVLGWVACAPRPLRWREIQCAISIDLDKEANNDGKRLVEEPKSLFSSFIELQANGMVDVVHGTARQ